MDPVKPKPARLMPAGTHQAAAPSKKMSRSKRAALAAKREAHEARTREHGYRAIAENAVLSSDTLRSIVRQQMDSDQMIREWLAWSQDVAALALSGRQPTPEEKRAISEKAQILKTWHDLILGAYRRAEESGEPYRSPFWSEGIVDQALSELW